MNRKLNLSAGEDIKSLAERLSRLPEVRRLDRPDEPESWTLAYTFHELENSFSRFVDDYLPKLMTQSLSDDETKSVLLEIGDEFRHILYHLRDSRFYDYVDDQDLTEAQ